MAKIDWSDPEEKASYMRDRWREVRRRWWEALCPTKTCHRCEAVKVESRQWVILPLALLPEGWPGLHGEGACCLSCARELNVTGYGGSRHRLTRKLHLLDI